ncbi:hypothetical protein OJF2_03520 [Aquisphaera giovannonii]|uniref:Uncharacterized protein n=1 Tax=Aquisphaera giovannonii TaxID=406548 RepID=A0A5B9VVS1_9BACT|nr:hypothetical protein [Aquisphaera giovannonii]QEH31885.1 hypothetical protein OJF2_03520 [Aquisphaera giovannonii]
MCPADKKTIVLALRGDMVHRLTVKAMMLKKKTNEVVEALQAGADLDSVGAKGVESLDARSIVKATVAPGNGVLTVHGGPDGATKLSFTTPGSDADAILAEILGRSGRSFETATEEIGVGEAIVPPLIVGAFAGLIWAVVYGMAGQLASGKEVEIKGRRQGMQQMALWVAELLGYNGTLAVGAVLGLLIVGWLVARLVKRPQRTVWLPAGAAATGVASA